MAQELRISTREKTCTFHVNGYTVRTLKRLGQGGFGEVYRAHTLESPEEDFALKVIGRCDTSKLEAREEYGIHQELTDADEKDCVVHVFGIHEILGKSLIFMQYIPTGDLFRRCILGRIDDKTSHRFFIQIIEGLKFMHDRGIVHRDIKPENLLVTSNGKIKITDFGLATRFRIDGIEYYVDGTHGTVCYCPPQIYFGDPMRGPPLDLWAAGVVLLNMVTGSNDHWDEAQPRDPNFFRWVENVESPDTIWHGVNKSIMGLLRRMLSLFEIRRLSIVQIQEDDWYLTGV